MDFKAKYEWRTPPATPKKERDAVAVELCRDLAQFANTDGGVLLIGVSEMRGVNGQKLAGEIKPVEDIDGFKQWMEPV